MGKKTGKNCELYSMWPTFSKRFLWCGLRTERNCPRDVSSTFATTQSEWAFSGGGASFPWKTFKFCKLSDLAHCWNFTSNKKLKCQCLNTSNKSHSLVSHDTTCSWFKYFGMNESIVLSFSAMMCSLNIMLRSIIICLLLAAKLILFSTEKRW